MLNVTYSRFPPVALLQHTGDRLLYSSVECFYRRIWMDCSGTIVGSPPLEPFILVANHGSYLDWGILDILFRQRFNRPLTFTAKPKVAQSRLWRPFVRHCRTFVIPDPPNKTAIRELFRKASLSATENAPIISIFPEGTRSPTGEPLPPATGAAWLSRRTGLPLLPVALEGFHAVWPPYRRFPRWKGKMLRVHFLDPLYPEDFPDDPKMITSAMGSIYRRLDKISANEHVRRHI
jgi:1-acyl-sn-glycerol-3-phosphate acyltransferase